MSFFLQVESSNIDGWHYNAETETLLVRFKNLKTYAYHDVPQSVVDDLSTAESVGSYISKSVARAFQYTLLQYDSCELCPHKRDTCGSAFTVSNKQLDKEDDTIVFCHKRWLEEQAVEVH